MQRRAWQPPAVFRRWLRTSSGRGGTGSSASSSSQAEASTGGRASRSRALEIIEQKALSSALSSTGARRRRRSTTPQKPLSFRLFGADGSGSSSSRPSGKNTTFQIAFTNEGPTKGGARRAAKTFASRRDGGLDLEESDDEDSNEMGVDYKKALRFRKLEPGTPGYVPLADFRGCPAVAGELKELAEVLKDPSRYARVGARPPKGVLFCGESGTGKTLAARVLASESQVPFLVLSGSDFRQSPWSGVGTSMVLKLFKQAKKLAPCVVFIDEVDTVGEARRSGSSGGILDGVDPSGSAKVDQDATLNALLAQMDGFDPTSGVLVLAATNRPEVLDEALLRPGRFDRRLEFRLPDAEGREAILRSCCETVQLEGDGPDFAGLAKRTAAFSPADLRGLVDLSAICAARAGRESVEADDWETGFRETLQRKAKSRPEGSFQVVERVDTTLQDVHGHDEAVSELRDLVDALVNREKYRKIGATAPRGVLLEGPPGVGKTHCARALAGEVGLPFLAASGSDFQASKYAGHGTQLVKRLFALAQRLQPCIVFLDEVDALARRRESSARGAEQDRENSLMQLLVELDGFGQNLSEVLVVAATNRADVLDPALLRPGRLDRRVSLDLPDAAGRLALLESHAKGKQFEEDVNFVELARRTSGLSGAEVKGLLNEAALRAGRRGAEAAGRADVTFATDRAQLGAEKVKPSISAHARRMTAVHEAGHAVLGLAFSEMTCRRLVRASIRPRLGGIGGVTLFEPFDEDAEGTLPPGLYTRRGSCAELCVDLGGRVAEEVMFRPSEVSSGASSDLRSATRRAMTMTCNWGLGGSLLSLEALGSQCSDATLRQAELAASGLLSAALSSARQVLKSPEGRKCLALVTERLLESEEADAQSLSASLDLEALRQVAESSIPHDWVE
ncbi:unnamed protein product [Polarella glacialis]|uniref:AAA+ ATPase domain-containing protein n=1 Tax=Polarella glacialis TaxID=89957 RepID=A0A813JQX8_POLGL|nr:unnamed protein product [Polarella glacialis]